MALSQTQLLKLQDFVQAGDRIGYYTYLETLGDAYAPLALGVVTNSTIFGAIANAFILESAASKGLTISDDTLAQIGLELMQADYTIRSQTGDSNLTVEQIRAYHISVFNNHGLPPEAWTAYVPLKYAGASGEAALWSSMLSDGFWANAYDNVTTVLGSGVDSTVTAWLTQIVEATTTSQTTGLGSNAYGNYQFSWNNSEIIGGSTGSDTLVGTDGADVIMTFDGGKNSANGGKGNDAIYGGFYDDQLVGGTGEDKLNGGHGDDILIGGESSVTDLSQLKLTDYHPEWNDGVSDTLSGGFGRDIYYISRENDYSYNKSLADSLSLIDIIDESSGDGIGEIRVQNHEVIDLVGGATEEQLNTIQTAGKYDVNHSNSNGTYYSNVSWTPQNASTQWIVQVLVSNILDDSGNPYLFLLPDYPDYGQPYAAIKGFRQGDFGIYLDGYIGPKEGTSGNDVIQGQGGTSPQIELAARLDTTSNSITLNSTPDSDQRIDGGAGDDIIYGWGGQDELRGSEGNDQLFGGDGADRLSGGDGEDLLDGGNGADTLLGNVGNDTLRGGAGSDTYIYASGDGSDVIDGEGDFAGDTDILSLQDINASDLTLSRNGDQLVLTVDATGDTITVNGEFTDGASASGIEQIQFADGTSIGRSDILASLGGGSTGQTITGTSGDDELTGTDGNDTIDGGLGNDLISGGAGSDTYLYRQGDGSDQIAEDNGSTADVDTLKLIDLNLSDVSFNRSGTDLSISINGTNDVISVYWQALDATQGYGLEKVLFADGMSADLYHGDIAWKINGTDGADQINSPQWGQSEIFDGGKGNDYLDGSAGSDTYLYASGDGSDEINDDVGFTDAGNTDVLRLTDLNLTDVALQRSGNNLLVTVAATGDVITIDNQFFASDQFYGIESIEFADGTSLARADFFSHLPSGTIGTSGDDTLTGTAGDDVFNGGLGNDLMSGGPGSDTYLYHLGDGSDQIAEDTISSADVDTLSLVDLNLSDVSFTRSGSDLSISINGTSDSISVYWQFAGPDQYSGLEKVLFANGMSADLYHGDYSWQINGTDGDDQITSPQWGQSEFFEGGKGNDYLDGSAGSDTYIYASGDGSDEINDDVGFNDDGNIDVLRLTDLNLTDVVLQRSGSNLLVNVTATGDVITVDNQFYASDQGYGIESIKFRDGTSLGRADLDSEFPSDPESNASFSASRMAIATSEDHIDLRPIDLTPVTFQLVSDDAATSAALDPQNETSSAVSTRQPAEANLTFWSTASDSYADSQTISDLRLNFDSNQDNVLDVNDARWDEFRVWRDTNANGIADSGELQSMTEAGIKLVNLLPSSYGSQAFSDGTTSTAYASADASKYLIGDATFVADPVVRNANAA